jgi:hypothetical protein
MLRGHRAFSSDTNKPFRWMSRSTGRPRIAGLGHDFLLRPARARRRTMKELLEAMAKALVDHPDHVRVHAI